MFCRVLCVCLVLSSYFTAYLYPFFPFILKQEGSKGVFQILFHTWILEKWSHHVYFKQHFRCHNFKRETFKSIFFLCGRLQGNLFMKWTEKNYSFTYTLGGKLWFLNSPNHDLNLASRLNPQPCSHWACHVLDHVLSGDTFYL